MPYLDLKKDLKNKIKAVGPHLAKHATKYSAGVLPALGALGGIAASEIAGVDDEYRQDATDKMQKLIDKDAPAAAVDTQLKAHGIPKYIKAVNSHDNDWLFKDTDTMREMQKSKLFGDYRDPKQGMLDSILDPNKTTIEARQNEIRYDKAKPFSDFSSLEYNKSGIPQYDKSLNNELEGKLKTINFRDDNKLTMPDSTELKIDTSYNNPESTSAKLKHDYLAKLDQNTGLKDKYTSKILETKPFVDKAQEIGQDYNDAQKKAWTNYGALGALTGAGASFAGRHLRNKQQK